MPMEEEEEQTVVPRLDVVRERTRLRRLLTQVELDEVSFDDWKPHTALLQEYLAPIIRNHCMPFETL